MSKITDYSFLFHSMFGTKSTKGASAIGSFQLSQLNSSSVQAQLRAAGIDTNSKQYKAAIKQMMSNANGAKLKDDGIKVYTIKKELHGEGITTMQTSFGHLVPVYNMERTICDIIRNRNNTEIQTFQTALKQYAKRKDKNLRLLMQYAAEFHVDKILRQYFEVLL